MRKAIFTNILIFFSLLSIICQPVARAGTEVPVFVSIVPQAYFVKKIAGDRVKISVMVQPGASPATYEPKPKQMVALSKARLYFSIGVPFERTWLPRFKSANPNMRLIPTDSGIRKLPMAEHGHYGNNEMSSRHTVGRHLNNPQGAMPDPHVWTSPLSVKIIAGNILGALLKTDPDYGDLYRANYQRFLKEIDGIDKKLKARFKRKNKLAFMVFHPSWGYFADTYGLHQVPVEIEGKAPKPSQLRDLIEYARERNIKVLFVQPQFSTRSAETIARAIGGAVVVADPLASDWAGNLDNLSEKIEKALR